MDRSIKFVMYVALVMLIDTIVWAVYSSAVIGGVTVGLYLFARHQYLGAIGWCLCSGFSATTLVLRDCVNNHEDSEYVQQEQEEQSEYGYS